MNAVTEEIDNAAARSLSSSAMEETSSMLLERRATIVGMKVRIEAPGPSSGEIPRHLVDDATQRCVAHLLFPGCF